MTEVTRILFAIEQGDPNAAEQLIPLVYDELRVPFTPASGLVPKWRQASYPRHFHRAGRFHG